MNSRSFSSMDLASSHVQKIVFFPSGFYTPRIFARWIISSFLQSIVLFFVPRAAFDVYSAMDSGHSQDVWTVGLAIYSAVVITINLRLGSCQ